MFGVLLLFAMWSGAFTDGHALPQSAIYNQNGCRGANASPDLKWSAPPPGTKSFVVIMRDVDADGFFHWVRINIPAGVRHLRTGSTVGKDVVTSWGQAAYGGPCPPPGRPHHYVLTLYAMDVATMPLFRGKLTGESVLNWVGHDALASATLTGTYGR